MSLRKGRAVLAALVLGACRLQSAAAPTSEGIAAAAPPAGFKVGVSRVDVTPPPGAALFGHALGGRVAIGHWLRLYCRAFYLERDALPKEPLVLVSCDLPMVSTHLQQSVAAYVDRKLARLDDSGEGNGARVSLDATRLSMVATHTHAGPGHYLGIKNLNGYTSSPHPGFDPKMVEFLANRIGDGILEAKERSSPAELRWVRGELLGLSRNAALWQREMEGEAAPTEVRAGCDRSRYPKDMREVDPALRLLEFRQRGTEVPLGGLAFYALHPTFIGNRNRHYHGDVYGVASRRVEQELRREWAFRCESTSKSGDESAAACASDPVFALVNTNQADAQPVRVSGSQDEVLRFAELLATAILSAHLVDASEASDGPRGGQGELSVSLTRSSGTDAPPALCGPRAGPWKPSPELGRSYVQVWLPDARVPKDPQSRLCPRGEMGWGSTKGSPSNPTVIRLLAPSLEKDANYKRDQQHRCGKKARNDRCQHPKASLQGRGFSKEVPLALLRVDDTFVSFVPAEVTAAAGALINKEVLAVARQSAPGSAVDAVVAGLANGYLSYVTTEKEYEAQAYHGASTLYGPHSAQFLANSYGCLTDRLLGRDAAESPCKLPGERGLAEFDRAREIAPHRHPQRKRLWRSGWDRGAPTTGGEAELLCQLPSSGIPKSMTEGTGDAVGGAALLEDVSSVSPAAHRQLCFGWAGAGPYAAMVAKPVPWMVRFERLAEATDSTPEAAWEPLEFPVRPLLTPELGSALAGAWRDRPITTWADDTGLAFTTRVHEFSKGRWRWSTVITLSEAEWATLTAAPTRIVAWDGAKLEFDANKITEDCRDKPEQMRRLCLVEH